MGLVELVVGAALGAVFGELLSEILRVKDDAMMFKCKLEELEETLRVLNEQLNGPDYQKEIITSRRLMEDGKKLVAKCSDVGWWNFHKRLRLHKKLVELDNKLSRFLGLRMQAHLARDQKQALSIVRQIAMSLNLAPDHLGYSNLTVGVNASPIGLSSEVALVVEIKIELRYEKCCSKAMKLVAAINRLASVVCYPRENRLNAIIFRNDGFDVVNVVRRYSWSERYVNPCVRKSWCLGAPKVTTTSSLQQCPLPV